MIRAHKSQVWLLRVISVFGLASLSTIILDCNLLRNRVSAQIASDIIWESGSLPATSSNKALNNLFAIMDIAQGEDEDDPPELERRDDSHIRKICNIIPSLPSCSQSTRVPLSPPTDAPPSPSDTDDDTSSSSSDEVEDTSLPSETAEDPSPPVSEDTSSLPSDSAIDDDGSPSLSSDSDTDDDDTSSLFSDGADDTSSPLRSGTAEALPSTNSQDPCAARVDLNEIPQNTPVDLSGVQGQARSESCPP